MSFLARLSGRGTAGGLGGEGTSGVRPRLESAFFAVLAIAPFSLGVAYGIAYYAGLADTEKYFAPAMGHRGWVLLAFLVLVAVCVGALVRYGSRIKGFIERHPVAVPTAILVAGFALRLAFIGGIGKGIAPYSDFQWAYEAAQGSRERSFHYSTFPAWGFYALGMEKAFALLPASYVTVQCLNAVFQAITIVGLYHLSRVASGSRAVGACASAMYALSPTAVFYCSLLSPEIPAVALFVLAALAILCGLRSWRTPGSLALMAAGGALLGVCEYLKPVSPIALIALVVMLALCCGRSVLRFRGYGSAEDAGVSGKGLAVLRALVSVALAFGLYQAVSVAEKRAVSDWLDAPVNESPAPAYLFIGLAHDGEGQIHLGERNHWHLSVYERHRYDFGAANSEIMAAVRDEVAQNLDQFPSLLVQKAKWAWQDDVVVFRVAQNQMGQTPLFVSIASIAQLYYIIVMLAAFCGAVVTLSASPQGRWGLLYIGLLVFGFFCLLLLSEAQSRYKVSIMPFVAVFSALGIDGILSLLRPRAAKGNRTMRLEERDER